MQKRGKKFELEPVNRGEMPAKRLCEGSREGNADT